METFNAVLEILGFNAYVKPAIAAFSLALCVVYFFGRMLFLIERPIVKNAIAAGVLGLYSILHTFDLMPQIIGDALMTFAGGVILYVLVGFRLFARINKLQDARLGDGSSEYKTLNVKKK
jgi:uncharacterized membrane protein